MDDSARETLNALRQHRVPPGWDAMVSEDDQIASTDSIVGWTDILKRTCVGVSGARVIVAMHVSGEGRRWMCLRWHYELHEARCSIEW